MYTSVQLIVEDCLQGSDAYEHLLHDVPSGDLHQLMGGQGYPGQLGGEPSLRGPFPGSLGDLRMSALSSMELPDAAAAVALLHDMNPEVLPNSVGNTAEQKVP